MANYTQGEVSSRKDVVPAGKYNIAIAGAEETVSSNGNTMIKLKIDVQGPFGGTQFNEGEGPIVYDNLVFTPAAVWKIDQFRDAIGEIVVPGESAEVIADELIGVVLAALLSVGDNGKGRDRNELEAYLPVVDDEAGDAF